VVYSPHGPEMLKDAEAQFEAAYPHVDLQWLDMGSQEVYNRVSAERARPACDVWWGGPSTMFMQAAEEGLLEPYRPRVRMPLTCVQGYGGPVVRYLPFSAGDSVQFAALHEGPDAAELGWDSGTCVARQNHLAANLRRQEPCGHSWAQ